MRDALRPSRWLGLGLLLVLSLRGLGWLAQRCWEPEAPAVRELLKGVAWDVALVMALFQLGRFLAALRRHAAAAWWRWPVRGAQVLLAALAVAAVVLRWLDAVHCFMTRTHWTADAFLYLDGGFSGTLRQPRVLAGLAAMAATALALPWALHRDSRHAALGPSRQALVLAGVALLLTLGPAAWAVRDGVQFAPPVNHVRLIPEVNFALQYLEATGQPNAPVPHLDAPTWDRFARLGLVPHATATDPDWPLYRKDNAFPALPYPPSGRASTQQPNLVLTFLESTNALFVHGLSGRYAGLMPNTSALVSRMTSVDRFYNTSSPTIAALVTALCSIHPSAFQQDLRVGQSVDGKAAYTCLADILRNHGYRTVFVQGARKRTTSKEYFLRTHGFDEVYGRGDLEPLYAGHPMGPWGPHDDDLVDYVEKTVTRLEAQRAVDGRPFLLVMLTLDTHEPGMAGPDCELPPDVADVPPGDAAHKLLASYHCSDRAVGRLGRFLLDGPRADRTMWLLTADHAAFSTLVPAEIYPDPWRRTMSARIPFLLHDPLHRLPARLDVLAGTQDIAPTLLQLLGLGKDENSMTGMSLFGRRPRHPFLVGRIGERFAFARTREASVELPVGTLREHCQRGLPLLQVQDVEFQACDLVAWLDWQDGLWASRHLFPPLRYRGADGIDKHSLAEQMELNPAERKLASERGALAPPSTAPHP